MIVRLARFLVVILPFVTQGCLLDIAPAREPLDATWRSHMLAGEYGTWFYGEKREYVGPDEIKSWPGAASGTLYGITVSDQSTFGGGGWSLTGGIVGRVKQPAASIELFGKEIARVHGLMRNVGPKDFSYDFFLVVRPTGTHRGRLVQQWRFPREALADRPAEDATPGFPHIVHGYLSFDEQSKIATITISGLLKPLQEHIDLSQEPVAIQ